MSFSAWSELTTISSKILARKNRSIIAVFLDSTKLKIVWIKITTLFKRRVSIIL